MVCLCKHAIDIMSIICYNREVKSDLVKNRSRLYITQFWRTLKMKNTLNGSKTAEKLVLEIGDAPKTKVVTGFITQPLNRNGFGIAVVDNFLGGGKPKGFSLLAGTGPCAIIESGARKPQFSETIVDRRAQHTDAVVLEVYRADNGAYRINSWAFKSEWDAVLETIKLGGRDHMSRSERFMARLAKCKQAVVAGMQKHATATAPSQKSKTREFKSFNELASASLG